MEQGTKIELTDPIEIKDFIDYCQHKKALQDERLAWREVKAFADKIKFGTFTLVVKDGLPVRIDNALQQVIIGIQI